jgi:hypothetical protein
VIEFSDRTVRNRQRLSGDTRIVSAVLPHSALSVDAILDNRA